MAESKSFKCILCNGEYKSKEELNEHFRSHANNSDETKQQSRGDKSVNSQTNSEKIPCDVCNLEFKSISIAIQHKYRKHPDAIMKFFCKFCGMQFPLKTTHDKHLNTHDNEKSQGNFPCSECNAQFVTESGRVYHIKSAHNRVTSLIKPVNTPPPSKKIRLNNANEAQSVYYCYLCGVPYINKFNLQRHLEKNHTENERNTIPTDMLKCTTCDALFYTKQAYDCHVFDHKPDDLYVTSEEQRLQTVARVDQDFDIRRVQLPTEKFIPNFKSFRKSTSTKKQTVKKLNRSSSDEELSPASEIESSDDETSKNTIAKTHNIKKTVNNQSENTKNNIVKKKFYAIVDSNGTVTQTCTKIPEKGVLTKTNLIKLKNSDILKTLQKSDAENVKIKLSKGSKISNITKNDSSVKQTLITTNKTKECDTNILETKKSGDTEKVLETEFTAKINDLNKKDPLTGQKSKVTSVVQTEKSDNSNKNKRNYDTQELKIVLNRLPEKYENILRKIKNDKVSC